MVKVYDEASLLGLAHEGSCRASSMNTRTSAGRPAGKGWPFLVQRPQEGVDCGHVATFDDVGHQLVSNFVPDPGGVSALAVTGDRAGR